MTELPTRPNFLVFCVDQMRADFMACAGHPAIRTPRLDRLAAEGVRFDRAYCNNPLCMPSRSTMLNGQTARGHGVRTNGVNLDPRLPTMTRTLVDHGYRTHSVGKLHFNCMFAPVGAAARNANPADWPESISLWREGRLTSLPLPYYGFQSAETAIGHGACLEGDYGAWIRREHPAEHKLAREQCRREGRRQKADTRFKADLPAELHPTAWIADRSIDFLEREGADRPFFLWTSFPDPHHPYTPPRPWADLYDDADLRPAHRREGELADLPWFYREIYERPLHLSGRTQPTRMDDADLRDILALTLSMISFIDDQIGRVVDALERLGLREDTVIVFLCDHGDLMGDHWMINKGPFHFEGLLRVPMIWSWPGRLAQGRATPALASLLDFVPTILDLAGGLPAPGDGAFGKEIEEHQLPALPGRSLSPVLRGEAASVQDSVIVENDEDWIGLRLRTLVTDRHKLTVYTGQEYGELFDLEADPDETRNLWNAPESQSLKADLTRRLFERLAETDTFLPRRVAHA